MKLRNQLLALLCLLIFGGFGFLYVRNWVVQQPFGVILFVSDGLVTRHLAAARLYEGGADHRLVLESLPKIAIVRNAARDFAVPDTASAATSIATGVKVNHRSVGVDAKGRTLASILEVARKKGRATGLITTGSLSAPGAAAYYAHSVDGRDTSALALQFLQYSPDVVFGGGAVDFLPVGQGGGRKDGRNIVADWQAKGGEVVRTKAELEGAAADYRRGVLGLFSPGLMAFSGEIESGGEQPSLSDMVRRAIESLQKNGKGYVLVVDAALVTTAAERNEGERVITETLALDRAVGTALHYAGDKALILAVGKHGTGGMSLNGYPLVQDHGVALLGTNASGQPAITWATGPNGQPLPANAPPEARNQPAAFQVPSGLNTAEDVIAVGVGPGSEKLSGFKDNTEIFSLIKEAL